MMRFKPTTFLILLLAGAFLVRLALVLALRDINQGPVGITSADDVEFNVLALHVWEGKGYVNWQGYPTSFRAPGWPLFMAGVYAVASPQPAAVYLACCALGALSCLLTYLLARELLSERAARAAALLAALYLPHAWFATQFVSENLFVPCLGLGLWLFLRHLRSGNLGLLVLAGLVLGWAALTRPFALLLFPILFGILVWAQLGRRQLRLLPLLALPATALAVVLPWTVRNYQVYHRFVLIATNGGSTFYGGNNSRVVHELRLLGSWVSTTELPHRDLIDATPDGVSHDQMEWRLGLAWLREHPGWIPAMCVCKAARLCFWLPDFEGGKRWHLVARAVGYAPFLLLFLVGGVRCLRRPRYRTAPWLALHGTLLATLLTALIFWGSPRFRDANVPVIMVYAAVGLQVLWHRWTRRVATDHPEGERVRVEESEAAGVPA